MQQISQIRVQICQAVDRLAEIGESLVALSSLLGEHDQVVQAAREYLKAVDDEPRMRDEYPAGTCNAEDAWKEHGQRKEQAYLRLKALLSEPTASSPG